MTNLSRTSVLRKGLRPGVNTEMQTRRVHHLEQDVVAVFRRRCDLFADRGRGVADRATRMSCCSR